MGVFHCPMGAAYYDDEPCIDCGLCSATTGEEIVEASRKIRGYLRSHSERIKSIGTICFDPQINDVGLKEKALSSPNAEKDINKITEQSLAEPR